jgi:hypothetical protein
MHWDVAVAWVAGLTVEGIGGWRLPTLIDSGTPGCNFAYQGTDCGFNVLTASGGTVYSEMAHLFYDTLGNVAFYDSQGNAPQPGSGLTNSGDFLNLTDQAYWTGLEYAVLPDRAWFSDFLLGVQGSVGKTAFDCAWPVHPGDVGVPLGAPANGVPEPASLGLVLLALTRLRQSRPLTR